MDVANSAYLFANNTILSSEPQMKISPVYDYIDQKGEVIYGSVEPQTITRYLQPNKTLSKDPYLSVYDQDIYVNNYVIEWKDTLTSDTLGNSFILNLIGGSQGIAGSILAAEILVKSKLGEISVATKDFSASCFYTLPFYNIYPRKMNAEMTGIMPATQSGDLLLLRIKVQSGAAARIMYGTTAGTNYLKILGPLKSPTLISPADKIMNASVNPMFTWSQSDAATSYHLQVSTLPDFSTTAFSDTSIVVTSKQVNNLEYSTKYYWRVKAKNFTGSGNWSEVWEFTTIAAMPAIPNLSSPTNGSINQPLTLTLTWNASEKTESYTLQVSDLPDFSKFMFNESGITQTSKAMSGLANNIRYYWRVRATNANGTSNWSEVRNFTTVPAIPAAPVLSIPANNSTNQPTALVITWNASNGAASYALQVSGNSDFTNLVVNKNGWTSTGYSVTGLVKGTKYYWRVSATNAGGTSAWSEIWNFSTIPPLPVTPILSLPYNWSYDQPLSLSLTWQVSENATTYSLQISVTSDFSSTIVNQSGLTTTSYSPAGLANGTKYFWRVNAANAFGTSDWSEIRNFTTEAKLYLTITIPSPGSKMVLGLRNDIRWDNNFQSVLVILLYKGGTLVDTIGISTDKYARSFIWDISPGYSPGSDYQIMIKDTLSKISGISSSFSLENPYIKFNSPNANTSWIRGSKNKMIWWNSNYSDSLYILLFKGESFIDTLVETDSFLGSYFWDVPLTLSSGDNYRIIIKDRKIGIEARSSYFKIVDPYINVTIPLSNSVWKRGTVQDILWTGNSSGPFKLYLYKGGTLKGTIGTTGEFVTIYHWKIDSLLPSGTDYSIVVKDTVYNITGASGFFTIITQATVPDIPVLLGPANGSVNQPASFSLAWNPADRAEFYSLQVSSQTDFSTTVIDENNLTATFRAISGLSNSTVYYWRVRAANIAGTGNWSQIWSFTTVSPVGIDELLLDNQIKIYPNPATGQITVEFSRPVTCDTEIRLFETSGKMVLVNKLISMKNEIDVSDLIPGIYMAEIRTGISVCNRKLVIQ